MAKDPAFLFYPGDYLLGTMHLDFECKGAYIELLMLQFNSDHMTLHMIHHVLSHKFEHIWPQIKDKFLEKDGKFWNERLKIEKELRVKYCKSRRSNKLGGDNPDEPNEHMTNHMTTHMNEHMSQHMENENINNNDIINCIEYIGITAKKILTNLEVEEYWKAFKHQQRDFYQNNGERKKHFKNWLKKEIQNGTPIKSISGNTKINSSQARMQAARDF